MKHNALLLAGLALAIWALLLVTATRSTLWDRDEARYATAALEMTNSGNLLYPTFNHELRAFQPVMVYWLMAAGIELIGPSELAVRLPSTVAMALICLLTGLIAREFLSNGLVAAAIAGTSPMLILTGTAATTDATLLLFILLSQWVFIQAWLGGSRWWHLPVMGTAIGCAMLTKGPLGLLTPVLSIGTALFLARGRSHAGPYAARLAGAATWGCAMFLAWGLPANAATGGEYWRIAIAERLPRRIFTAMEDHGGEGLIPYLLHLPYYPLVMAIGFLPWTMYLVLSFSKKQQLAGGSWARSYDGLRVLLIAMILPLLVLITLIVSKLPHYIQPAMPWLAILVAAGIAMSGDGTAHRKPLRISFLIFGGLALVGGVALILIPWLWPPLSSFRMPAGVLGGMLLLPLPLIGRLFWQGRVVLAMKVHAVGVALWVLAAGFFLFPALEKTVKPAQNLAVEARGSLTPLTSLATFGWHEPGMHFYFGGRKIRHLHDAGSVEAWLREPGPGLLVLNETAAGELPFSMHEYSTVARQKGIDHVQGKILRLTVLNRETARLPQTLLQR